MTSAFEGNCEIASVLMANKANVEQRREKTGHTALILAVEQNQLEMVELLLEKGGANVNVTNDEGWSPLMISAFLGNCEIASVLMANKANVEQRIEKTGATALTLAVKQNQLKMVELLLEKGGANVNVTDDEGESPLMTSAFEGNCEVASVLMANKANAEQRREKTGATALIIACLLYTSPSPRD